MKVEFGFINQIFRHLMVFEFFWAGVELVRISDINPNQRSYMDEDYQNDKKGNISVKSLVQHESCLFRPPHASNNLHNIDTTLLLIFLPKTYTDLK